MGWTRKLSAEIILDDGRTFATLKDAADFMLTLSELRQRQTHWQHAADLMMRAARPRSPLAELEVAERQLMIALSAQGEIGLKDARAKPRKRPRWRRR